MPTWKKVIVSGSQAHLQGITASNIASASNANFLLYNSTSGQFTYLSTSSIGNIQGRGTATEVTFWDGPNSITGSSNFLWNNNTRVLSVSGDLSVGTLTGNNTVTLDAQTVKLNFPLSSTANVANVLVLTSSNRIATQSIDTRVFGTTLISGSGIANQIAYFNATTGIAGDAGLTYDASSDTVTVAGDLFVNGANIKSSNSTVTVFNAATNITIGNTTGTTTVRNNLVVGGDLTVNGTTTTIDTANLTVEDKFIILAHGSGSVSPRGEGGIIVEGSTADRGQAFIFNSGSAASTTGRWGLAADVHMTSSDVTPDDFMVSAYQASGVPSAAPTYGGSLGGYGNIYVNSLDESIWIFS